MKNAKPVNLENFPPKSRSFLEREAKVTCHNYSSLPVVLSHGKGVFLWDVEGKFEEVFALKNFWLKNFRQEKKFHKGKGFK